MVKNQNNKVVERDWFWLDCHYMSGACYSYENSLIHFKYSELAAANKDYGFSISHLVLGMEELIKSLVLICLDVSPYFLTTSEKDRIFTKHDFKHINIKELLTSMLSSRIEAYHENPFEEENYKFQTTAHFISMGLKLGEIEESEKNALIELMNQANNYKNNGFYVDFRGDWKSPADIDNEAYIKYKKLTEKLLSFIQPIFTMPLADDRLQHFLDGKWV